MSEYLFRIVLHLASGTCSKYYQVFHHTQADRKVKNFYANDSLLRVTTEANLIALLQEQHRYI